VNASIRISAMLKKDVVIYPNKKLKTFLKKKKKNLKLKSQLRN